MADDKTPRERFESLAPKRVENVLKALKVLGNCGNRSTYEYAQVEATDMLTAVEKAFDECVEKFAPKGAGLSYELPGRPPRPDPPGRGYARPSHEF